MKNLKNDSSNNEIIVDGQPNQAGDASANVGSNEGGSRKKDKSKKGYLSWKTLFLLFIFFRAIAYFSSKDSIFFAAVSLLWGVCLAMAIVALITYLLSNKKDSN